MHYQLESFLQMAPQLHFSRPRCLSSWCFCVIIHKVEGITVVLWFHLSAMQIIFSSFWITFQSVFTPPHPSSNMSTWITDGRNFPNRVSECPSALICCMNIKQPSATREPEYDLLISRAHPPSFSGDTSQPLKSGNSNTSGTLNN